MTNLDKIGKDHAKLMIEAFGFLKDKEGAMDIIKNTKMFKFLNNDYTWTYDRPIYETRKLEKPKRVGNYVRGYRHGTKTITEERVLVGKEKIVYKDKVRKDKNNEYVNHSKIICALELKLLSDLEVVNEQEYGRLNNMLQSPDPEIAKLAESIIYQKRPLKQKQIKKIKKLV